MKGSVIDRCGYIGDEGGFEWSREEGATRVRLSASLPPAWVGNFALQASALGIQIEAGHAVRIGATRWEVTLLLRSADTAARMQGCDFLRMARRAPRVLPPLPQPDVRIDLREGSRLVVAHVTGEDAIGLLAHTLQRFEALSLRPRKLSLCTIGSTRDDWFWLERV